MTRDDFQHGVSKWLIACFGEEISHDRDERSHRFLEEALELYQAAGRSKQEALQLVDYVYARDVGMMPQEVGGVMTTLAAFCYAHDLDMQRCGDAELDRVWTKLEQIRAKQAAKPKNSPLAASPIKPGESA
jgi:NTP pyrophosphatase (non-canonical NTP hydrolase)